MKIIRRACFLVASVVCLLPCAASAQQDTPAAGATVYVYRMRESYAMALKPSVFCDGKQLLRMRNGRFAKFSVPAGEHTITSTFEGNGLSVTLEPGKTYYIRLEMSRPAMFHNARGQVTEVADGQGKFEVDNLKPAESDDLKGEPLAAAPANRATPN